METYIYIYIAAVYSYVTELYHAVSRLWVFLAWLVQFTLINNTVDGKKENLANSTMSACGAVLVNNSDKDFTLDQ